jgi:hypothetical protein
MMPRFRVNRGRNGFLLFVVDVLFGQQWQKGDKLGNRRFGAAKPRPCPASVHTDYLF